MQRLFSSFPTSWPGCALLLLRFVAATPLLIGSISFLSGITHSSVLIVQLIALAIGGLLAAGFCTPYAAAVQAVVNFTMAMKGDGFHADHAVLAIIGLSLIMLGPGAWSIDAQLFGRKRIDLNGG